MAQRALAWALMLLACAGDPWAAEDARPRVPYPNELLGVYAGERQANGTTRIILHRKGKGGWREVHFVNGTRLDCKGSHPFHGLVVGEVALEEGAALEVYSGCVSNELFRTKDDAAMLKALRAAGARPFRLTPAEVKEQARKLAAALDPLYRKRDTKRAGLYITLLRLIGRPAHADIVEAYLGGNRYAGLSLDSTASAYVASIWPEQSEAARWKLVELERCVERTLADAFALASLDSESEEHRRKAIRWLGKHKVADARAPLLGRLNTAAPRLRWDIVGALTRIGGKDVVDAFIELLAPDSWAAKGLGLVAWPGFPPYWYGDGRVAIVRALGELADVRAAPALFKVLEEKGPGRGYLAEFIVPVLAQMGYKEAILTLEVILTAETLAGVPGDKPWIDAAAVRATVRRVTARALYALGDLSGRELLVRELKTGDWQVRRFAAETFARHGVRRDVPVLAACLRDRDSEVLRWACRGFARLTGAQGRDRDWLTAEAKDLSSGALLQWWEQHKAEFGDQPH